MPRKGRLHISGGCYHVFGRGLERRYIFHETSDKEDFLSRLGRCLFRSQAQCLAWAIMSDHYHLLIRVGPQPLSKLMGSLLGGYGGSYNRRHGRVGYVFQNRFRSILCEEDSYLLELIRYIHLNPMTAGMVDELSQLDRYPWTGHSGIVAKKNRYCWHLVDEVLSLFGDKRGAAKSAYRQFIKDGISGQNHELYSGGGLIRSNGGWEAISKFRSEHLHCIGDERILGSSHFVEVALFEDELRVEKRTLREQQGWNFDKLVGCICDYFELPEQSIETKARKNKLALVKSLICYWAVEELGLSLTEIGKRLTISQQSVSKWVNQGRAYCNSEKISLDDMAG